MRDSAPKTLVLSQAASLGDLRRDFSLSASVAGVIAVMVSYGGPAAIIFQAASLAGLSADQLTSWIWAISIGSGLAGVILSLAYRAPVIIAWSTPGAALLAAGWAAYPYPEAIGAFVFGMVMCILYIKTGTLIIPIIGHMLNNLLAYGMQMLSNINQQNSALVSSTPHPNIGVAAFLLIVAGMIILYFLYRNWPRAYWNPPYFQQDYQGVQENYYY